MNDSLAQVLGDSGAKGLTVLEWRALLPFHKSRSGWQMVQEGSELWDAVQALVERGFLRGEGEEGLAAAAALVKIDVDRGVARNVGGDWYWFSITRAGRTVVTDTLAQVLQIVEFSDGK